MSFNRALISGVLQRDDYISSLFSPFVCDTCRFRAQKF